MSQTTVNLGHVPVNRGEYSSSATYYKDNIVQYNGSSYICNVTEEDISHPTGISGITPYDSDPASPNTGWAVFANDSSGAGEGVYNVSVDHTTDNQPKIYASLSAALNDIPAAKKKGGMEIRFIFNNSNYAVDKEEGITTQPAGTLITSSPTMVDGTYKASQLLTYFSTLPTATGAGNAVVYYKEVDGTYTTWTITLQSSDNKYVQYRCIANTFSANPEDWAIADEGVYVENPEFVYVKMDSEDKILFAIKVNGEPYFGVGCPEQVKEYVEQKIADLSLDEYEDIVSFLSDYLGSDTTLKVMIDEINNSISNLSNTKVDKEEGKSLIDSGYASTKSTIDNPEFLDVTLDEEDKVLEGIQADGTKVIGGDLNVEGSANINGDLRVLGNMEVSGVSYKVIENPEYLVAWVDAEYKVIFGFKTDGKTYIGDADFFNEIKNNQEAISEIKSYLANFDNLDIDALSSITVIENPEYIDVKVDSEDKILEGITTDGIKKINIPVDNGAAIIEATDNPEFLEAKVDAEGKLIEGINKNGEKIFGVIPPQIKQYIDENMPLGGSGIQSIEYDNATGDMYATYDDERGVTDVSMDSNGDIYVEYETGV